jgi:hypothetical protein
VLTIESNKIPGGQLWHWVELRLAVLEGAVGVALYNSLSDVLERPVISQASHAVKTIHIPISDIRRVDSVLIRNEPLDGVSRVRIWHAAVVSTPRDSASSLIPTSEN